MGNKKFSSKRPLTDDEEAEIQRMIASDPDNPELTDEQLAKGLSFAEAFPSLAASAKRGRGRPHADRPKIPVTIRLDADVIERFKATGPGWQTRMNDILRKATIAS